MNAPSMIRRPTSPVLLVLCLLLLVSCGTGPQLVNMWYDTDYQGPRFQKFVVVGVSAQEGQRRLFEDTFVSTMQHYDINAVASYKLLDGTGQPDQDQLQQAIAASGADAILMTHLLAVDQKTAYQPGYTTAAPGYRYDFYGYYGSAYGAVSTPGYVYNYDVARLETNLYQVDGGDLLWSGTTETVDFSSIEKEVPKLAALVMDSLSKKGLL